MPGVYHGQNMLEIFDLFVFVSVRNCLNLYQCGNVVGAPAKINRSKAPLQTQRNQLNEFVIPTPWLADLNMPRRIWATPPAFLIDSNWTCFHDIECTPINPINKTTRRGITNRCFEIYIPSSTTGPFLTRFAYGIPKHRGEGPTPAHRITKSQQIITK